MIVSSIDIGTNTVLMATIEVAPGRPARVLGDEHSIARLGKGVDASRRVSPEAVHRVCECLLRYTRMSEKLNTDRLVAFATSALRDAENRDEVVEQIRHETGLSVRILTGHEEAEFTFIGALFGLDGFDGECAVIDIGGGSTELAIGTRRQGVERATSLDIGAVRLTERFLHSAPPVATDVQRARAWAGAMADGFEPLTPNVPLVGVAGTVTTIGALAAGLPRFDANELNGYPLDARDVTSWLDRLARLTHDDIRRLPPVHPDRADVLLGGVIILEAALTRLGVDRVVVSTRGVRYGLALEQVPRATEA